MTYQTVVPGPSRWVHFSIACLTLLIGESARASIAYGSINNFDTVNDTGSECHGFEIEIEDCHSTDISYTYDYNHYGTPKITQDDSVAGHPKCIIRWESKKNPDGSWASYTAIPNGPINPTDGHQFTNPNINFGGEHFGVGYNVAVVAIRYHWLVDQAGALVRGGAVQVSTPSFTYYPPQAPAPGVAFAMEWSLAPAGWILEESPSLAPGSWKNSERPDAPHDGLHHVEVPEPAPTHLFFRLKKP